MSFYSIVKKIYKTMFPKTMRDWTHKYMPRPLKASKAYIIRELEKSGKHNEIYDESFYATYLYPEMVNSYQWIAKSIVEMFSPKSVVDIGCGRGQLLSALKKRGVVCRGLEYSSAALNICRQNSLDVTKFDLELDMLPKDFRADVVISTEVAEHLPERCADRFVGILCAIADNVVMTAAEPARTWEDIAAAHDHVNEQPKQYWIAKFADKGFKYDEYTSIQLCTEWKGRQVLRFFVERLMVFCRQLRSAV